MSVSKRLRYEILRRDNHACRYCGQAAPDVALTIDHVVPIALGGSDDPTNLAAACADCNGGKSATTPDSPLVDDVGQDALRWSKAMQRAANIQWNHEEYLRDSEVVFDGYWHAWTYADGEHVPLPNDWNRTIRLFVSYGLDVEALDTAIRTAMQAPKVSPDQVWRYFCGVCWRMLDERRDIATNLLAAEETEDGA